MEYNGYRWFSARLQYLQCVSSGDTAVLQLAIDIHISSFLITHMEQVAEMLPRGM